MANQIYQSMQQPSIMSAIRNLKQNPMQFFMQRNLNIPQNIANDPNAIIQHLMNTGQITQQKYNQVMQMVGRMR